MAFMDGAELNLGQALRASIGTSSGRVCSTVFMVIVAELRDEMR